MLRVASVALCVASVSGHGCITWPTSRNAVDAHEISCDANTDGCRCGTSLPPSPPPASVCPPAPLLLSRAQPHGAWDWLCQRNAPGAALHERTGFILVQPRVSHRGLCVQLLHWLPHVRPPERAPPDGPVWARQEGDPPSVRSLCQPQGAPLLGARRLPGMPGSLSLAVALSASDYGFVGSTTRGQLQAQLRSQTRVASLVALPGTGTARRRAITSTLRTPATAKRERPSRRCRQASSGRSAGKGKSSGKCATTTVAATRTACAQRTLRSPKHASRSTSSISTPRKRHCCSRTART